MISDVENVCQILKERSVTIPAFCAKAGITPSIIYKWKRGQSFPNLITIKKINKALANDFYDTPAKPEKKEGE